MRRATVLGGAVAIAVWLTGDALSHAASHAAVTANMPVSDVVAAYFASWKKPRPDDSAARQLSHLFYAFGAVSSKGLAQLADPCTDAGLCGGDSASFGSANFAALGSLKRRNPRLRVLISLGGWNGSEYFSDAAATPQSREAFAQSIIDVFFRPYPGLFDGVDIDWEYPVAGGMDGNRHRPSDRENFVALMAKIRNKLELALGVRRPPL